MSELVQMQQQVIHVLHSALMGGHLDTNRLAMATNTRTDNTISVLNNQYQRIATAAPIQRSIEPRNLPLRRPRLCPEAERLLMMPSATPRYKSSHFIPHPKDPNLFGRECASCPSTWNARPVGLITDPATKLRYPSDFQFRCHTPVNELYLCYLCGPEHESPVLDGHAELMAHLRTHSQNDLLRPAKLSPPPVMADVGGEEEESAEKRAWMPDRWKGGYVEGDMAHASSPGRSCLKVSSATGSARTSSTRTSSGVANG